MRWAPQPFGVPPVQPQGLYRPLDSLVSPAFSLLLLLLFNMPCMPSGKGWAWGSMRPFDAVPFEPQTTEEPEEVSSNK